MGNITTFDAAKALGISPAGVRAVLRRHSKGKKIGRDWFLTAADLDWLRTRPRVGFPKGKSRKSA